jgi:hypothetical protein
MAMIHVSGREARPLITAKVVATLKGTPLFRQAKAVRAALRAIKAAEAGFQVASVVSDEMEANVVERADLLLRALENLSTVSARSWDEPRQGLARFGFDLEDFNHQQAADVIPCVRLAEGLIQRLSENPQHWFHSERPLFERHLAEVALASERLKCAVALMVNAWKVRNAAQVELLDAEQDWEAAYQRVKRKCRSVREAEAVFGERWVGKAA